MLSSMISMSIRAPHMKHILQLSLSEICKTFEDAARKAIAEDVALGLPVTWEINGQVVDLLPDDPRLLEFLSEGDEDCHDVAA